MDGDNSDIDQMDYPKYARSDPTIRQRIFGNTTTKLGSIATGASLRIKQFVTHEVHLPPPKEIFEGLVHMMPGTGQTEDEKRETKKEKKKRQNESDIKEAEEDKNQKLQKILSESNEVLASAQTVFPFALFPDSVVLDRTKVTITRRNFFFSSEVMSMRIDDILNVTASVGPFLGSVTLAGRVLSSEDHFTIENFWRKDAIKLKHIIQGYIIARHNKIDCAHLPKDELIDTLTKLGHDSNS